MKRALLMFLFVFYSLLSYAPAEKFFRIEQPEPIKPYVKLIHATGTIESSHDTLAYNSIEKATGYFQIRPIRLKDYNKRTNNNYKLNDMFNYHIAEKIFLYYADLIGPYNFEKIAKNWNGSGPMTILYWNKVKKHL